jgi:hypothetical protein
MPRASATSIAVRRLALVAALCTLGCSSSDATGTNGAHVDDGRDDPSMKSCDPLAGAPAPIALTNFVAAGKHPDGTTYVIDRASDYRAFESEGGALQRRVVVGSGSEGSTDGFVAISVNEPSPFSLKVELAGGVPQRMGIVRGTITGKTFEIGAQGDVLALLPRTAIDALPLKNLPGNAIVESAWTLAGDKRFYVVRPEQDWTYADFRVFFGVSTRMVERPVIDVSRGSATYLRFMLDGREVVAYLGSSLASDPSSRLTIDGTAYALTATAPATTSLAFFCR